MTTPSLTGLAAVVGGLAVSLTAAAGVASADPDLSPVVNTTCNYSQVVDAMNDQSPAAAEDFNASPIAQSWLHRFLAAPPDQRQPMLDELKGTPSAEQYVDALPQLASVCNNY